MQFFQFLRDTGMTEPPADKTRARPLLVQLLLLGFQTSIWPGNCASSRVLYSSGERRGLAERDDAGLAAGVAFLAEIRTAVIGCGPLGHPIVIAAGEFLDDAVASTPAYASPRC